MSEGVRVRVLLGIWDKGYLDGVSLHAMVIVYDASRLDSVGVINIFWRMFGFWTLS